MNHGEHLRLSELELVIDTSSVKKKQVIDTNKG